MRGSKGTHSDEDLVVEAVRAVRAVRVQGIGFRL